MDIAYGIASQEICTKIPFKYNNFFFVYAQICYNRVLRMCKLVRTEKKKTVRNAFCIVARNRIKENPRNLFDI